MNLINKRNILINSTTITKFNINKIITTSLLFNMSNNSNNNSCSVKSFCSSKTPNSLNDSKIELHKKHCQPCEGGIPALEENLKISLLENVDKDWKLDNDKKKISRNWRIPFSKSIEYLNEISKIADEEGHHPDISIESFWNFKITIYTHSINDLTENDYILASKIDLLNIKSIEPRKKKSPANPEINK